MKLQRTLPPAAAGLSAMAAREAAETLFHAGGSALLGEATRDALRTGAQEAVARSLGTALPGSAGVVRTLLGTVGLTGAKAAVAKGAAVSAAKRAARSLGASAAVGVVVDGALGAAEGVRRVRAGAATKREACVHALKEAGKGGLASAAGTAAAVGLVALTGPVAPAALFVVGVAGAGGARVLLDRLG